MFDDAIKATLEKMRLEKKADSNEENASYKSSVLLFYMLNQLKLEDGVSQDIIKELKKDIECFSSYLRNRNLEQDFEEFKRERQHSPNRIRFSP